jgi:hypothetical protein
MKTVTRNKLDLAVDKLNERIPGMDFSIGYGGGGAKLERRSGYVDVSPRGTKREILTYIHGMLEGVDSLFDAFPN